MLESHKLHSIGHVRNLALSGLEYRDWYERATREIKLVSTFERWPVTQFSDTLAILSPRVSVRRNVRATLIYYGQGRKHVASTMRNVRRSLEIYEQTGIIGGNKVPFFADSLRGNVESVCLDTWMSVALLDCDEPTIKQFTRKNTFASACELVRTVGQQLGLTPRDCQACVWCGVFRTSGRIPPYYPIIEEYERWLGYNREFPLVGNIGEPKADDISASDWLESVLADNESFDYGTNVGDVDGF